MDSDYKDYRISDDLQRIDFDKVTRWLAGTYWSPGIGRPEVEKGAKHSSLVIGAYDAQGRQVGYARVASDKTRFAYIMDVFVESSHRNQGIAQVILRFALNHPEYQSVYQWLLATRDAHSVYSKLEFKPLPYPDRWMILNKGRA